MPVQSGGTEIIMFNEKLNEYMALIGCSGRELAKYSGISEASVSRYKSGERTPAPESEDLCGLCRGICAAAEAAGKGGISYDSVFDELNGIAAESAFNYEAFRIKFDMLCTALSVRISDMAKKLKYDSSYISRIRSGSRKPAKPEKFAQSAAEYVVRSCGKKRSVLDELLHLRQPNMKTDAEYILAIASWLTDGAAPYCTENPMMKFLIKLGDFNLGDYMRAIRFDDLKIPTRTHRLPLSKNYYGIEEMKRGELDFLKLTALSEPGGESVFMCSDMQMDDMAADMEFSKKYMFGLAAVLKKGFHLNVVHNLNRPFNELMLGLECWIPLYMTGQISPYYLSGVHNRVFCHFLNISSTAALTGESISGFHDKGRYYLTSKQKELSYCRERAKCIMEKALPLMQIYNSEKQSEFNLFLSTGAKIRGKRRSLLSTLPIFTAERDFLSRFLKKRGVSDADAESIILFAESSKKNTLSITEHSSVSACVPYLTEEEFAQAPPLLDLSRFFYHTEFAYTYEEYTEHLAMTEEFAKKRRGFSLSRREYNPFGNINIYIHEKNFAVISKSAVPSTHFVVRHPILRGAIENIDFPV